MQTAFRFFLGFGLAAPLFAQRDIGTINVAADTQTTAISISSSSPELQNLALKAWCPRSLPHRRQRRRLHHHLRPGGPPR
jgi:hypothetical protein